MIALPFSRKSRRLRAIAHQLPALYEARDLLADLIATRVTRHKTRSALHRDSARATNDALALELEALRLRGVRPDPLREAGL